MLIYMATNRIDGKEYIGQTIRSFEQRKQEHISDALNKRNTMYFHKAIRKHGPENFDWEILHDNITNIDDLNRSEIHYIKLYDTFNNGYNLTEGGWNALPSEETKKKIGLKCIGRHPSEETLKKMSESQRGKNGYWYGKEFSIEHRRNISKNNRDMFGKKNTMFGRTGKDSPVSRTVIIDNKLFNSLTEASIFFKLTKSAIRYRILHKTKWLEYSFKQGV